MASAPFSFTFAMDSFRSLRNLIYEDDKKRILFFDAYLVRTGFNVWWMVEKALLFSSQLHMTASLVIDL